MAETPIFEPAEIFECPICAGEVTDNDLTCPHCGTEFEPEEEVQETKEEVVEATPPPPPPDNLNLVHIYEQNNGILSSVEEIHERLDAICDAQEKLEKDVADIKNRAAIGKKKDASSRTIFADELERGDDEQEPVLENIPPVVTNVAPPPRAPATNPTAESKRSITEIIKELSQLNGIGDSRAEKLAEAGIESIEQVAEMRLTKPMKTAFGGEKRAKKAQEHAKELVKAR